ncbi:DUF58 domain-containing protein [Brevibacterium litoralis]|uniref:DUF58 domain-containing protein n=1 Tax=Brevibacterium litoralis TaxID=3138935 RepID=UPI0032ECB4F8
MAALLTKVKARMSIHAHRRTRGLLEGEYASVFHGHSMDFDDLREYVPGDEIRDIDWKATARHTTPLVKRYVAHRRHALAIVTDTGIGLDAVSASGEPKREVAIMLAGMAGYLAVRHGDDVMLVDGWGQHTRHSEKKGTEAHLEQLLRRIQSAQAPAGFPADRSSDIGVRLQWVAEHLRKRMLVIVLADDAPLDRLDPRLLRRLDVQHELMWMTIADADLESFSRGTDSPFDIVDPTGTGLPPEILRGAGLWEEYRAAEARRIAANEEVLRTAGIPFTRVAGTDDSLEQLRRLMRRQHGGR